jgi:class 3 adenylate cyclase
VELFRRSLDVNRTYPLSYFYIAAALAHLGGLSEARSEVRAGLALAPRFSIARFRAGSESDNPTYLAQRERIIEGMRKAGVPECEIRKLASILVVDVVGYSRLAGADEDRTLAHMRGLRSDLIDPAIAAHYGRIVKRTGDGSIVEFRSVVDSVPALSRCRPAWSRALRSISVAGLSNEGSLST